MTLTPSQPFDFVIYKHSQTKSFILIQRHLILSWPLLSLNVTSSNQPLDWRPLPFYTALSHGCISIESDVWLYNSTLYVGHEQSALTPSRTFQSLYIDPILDVLTRQNPSSQFVTGKTYNGVYDTDAGQTLYLFVDLKTDGLKTWPYVVQALEPLYTPPTPCQNIRTNLTTSQS
jgi:hypothetical protein